MNSKLLGEPLDLGGGRSIRPPQGWIVSGRVAEDPLRVQPGSRVVIAPNDGSQVSILWRAATWLVGKPSSQQFTFLLDIPRELFREQLEPLYPDLIRIALENITEARVKKHRGMGTVLAITYLSSESGWAGHILYAPTGEVQGEVQILSYEGLEIPYLTYMQQAMASMESFRDARLGLLPP